MKNSKIQLYTGNGKGKTTAALGLAFRASGAGMKTIVIQFLKAQKTSELKAAEKNDFIEIEQFGANEFFIIGKSNFLEHRKHSSKALERAKEVMDSKSHDILILDEIFHALENDLITYEELINLITSKTDTIELVLTGRNAPTDIYEHCDLITEFNEVKHYYNNGTQARKGIEL